MKEDIVTRLRDADGGYGFLGIVRQAADEIERLRVERDEARREVCEWISLQTKRKTRGIAQNRGWDCFKKEDE